MFYKVTEQHSHDINGHHVGKNFGPFLAFSTTSFENFDNFIPSQTI